VKRIRPSTEDDTLSVRLMFLKIQQMTDQHLDLRPVTPEAFHFADGFEEICVDIVVPDDTSGFGSWFVKSGILSGNVVGGVILNAELLQLVWVDGNTRGGLQSTELLRGYSEHTDKRDKLSLLFAKSKLLGNPDTGAQHRLT